MSTYSLLINERACALVQVDKKMAIAYYWRGVTKVKLKQPRGVQDFNKALAIDGKIFQVRLHYSYVRCTAIFFFS